MSFAILATALAVLLQGLLTLTHARQSAAERHRVATALSRAFETLEAMGPTGSYESYKPDAAGEPFLVPSIQDQAGHPVAVGIQFFVDETANSPELGLPRDLDGDGAISNADVGVLGADGKIAATMLPVKLTVSWRSFDGSSRSLEWTGVITST